MKERTSYRWFVVIVFFFFMLLHQSDKLLIAPLTTRIMEEFNISRTAMGSVTTVSLLVATLFYPLWGYLYDRFARSKLLALASFIWGATTWLSAIAPTFSLFRVTRASTGIDDSSYPGLYSLIADYFGPKVRGKVYGLLQLAMPLGYLLGTILGLFLGGLIGWRGVFYFTGSLGIVLSLVILLAVPEVARGSSEAELQGVDIPTYTFSWQAAKTLLQRPSLRWLYVQGFFGIFPWNVITFWFFNYLETERNYSENQVFITMVVAVLVLAAGYPIGGALGDALFRRNPRGRLIVAGTGVLIGAVLLFITLNIPNEQVTLFMVMLVATALFIPFAAPNVLSTVYDVSLPEVRSSANSVMKLIEDSGAAVAPLLAGFIADQSNLKTAFLVICITAWLLCAFFFLFAARWLPRDIDQLHETLRQRADAAEKISPLAVSIEPE